MSYRKEAPETISAMFTSIAKNYDLANAILSLGMHHRWNRALIHKVLERERPSIFLDLCCGTGAISLEYLKSTSTPTTAYLLDFSEGMLTCAKEKAKRHSSSHQIHYLQADAQQIPLTPHSVECVTLAYGIRNIKDPQQCLNEIHRVLMPEGTVGILELTQPKNRCLRLGHTLYLRTFLPLVGKVLTSNKAAYQYLCQSIPNFVSPSQLETMMKTSGFSDIQRISFLGGAAILLIGKKDKNRYTHPL